MKLSDRFTSYKNMDSGKIHPTDLLQAHRKGCPGNRGEDCTCGLYEARRAISQILEMGEAIEAAILRIEEWSEKAYPENVFPEPDFVKARSLLIAGDQYLDNISASNFRQVLRRVVEILRESIDIPEGGR